MKNVEIAFAKPIVNIMPQLIGEDIFSTDSISKAQVISVKGADGVALEVSPLELVGLEGREWRLSGSGEVPGFGQFSVELDVQTGVVKLCGQPELNDLVLTLGVELENLNRRPA